MVFPPTRVTFEVWRAGSPNAPRLVTLDEAFAGVDDNVVMTSEREWGCVAAVLVSNWEWDGSKRTRADRPVQPTQPAAEPEPVATPQEGLWG